MEIELFDKPRIQKALELRNKESLFHQLNPRLLELARRPVLLDLIEKYPKPFDASTRLCDLYERYIDRMLLRGDEERFEERAAASLMRLPGRFRTPAPNPPPNSKPVSRN